MVSSGKGILNSSGNADDGGGESEDKDDDSWSMGVWWFPPVSWDSWGLACTWFGSWLLFSPPGGLRRLWRPVWGCESGGSNSKDENLVLLVVWLLLLVEMGLCL